MANKGKKFPAEILTRDEIRSMLRVFGVGPVSIRNRAVLIVLWRAGLRSGEVLSLDGSDLNQVQKTLRIRESKNGRARTAVLDPEALAVVQVWLAVRQKKGIRTRPLFPTMAGARLSTRYLRSLFPRIAERAGIRKRVHPHAFRHTFAVELMREGKSIALISSALGHSSIAITAKYLAHLEDGELVEAIQSRPRWAGEV